MEVRRTEIAMHTATAEVATRLNDGKQVQRKCEAEPSGHDVAHKQAKMDR